MPRVHFVKKARKDNPVVKKGESYYWWKFRFGGKRFSVTRPKRSQLTQSSFLAALYDIEDGLGEEMTEDDINLLVADLENLRDECECSLSNMPEQLQDSSESGMLLQERIDMIGDWILEIESIDWESVSSQEAAEFIAETNPGIP